jgi:hypothetical protein
VAGPNPDDYAPEAIDDPSTMGPVSGAMFNQETPTEPAPANLPGGAYVGNDPMGDPYDRKWPGMGKTSVKPYMYGWYDFEPEVRFAAIMNSWLIINNAVHGAGQELFAQDVTDDMLMVLGWGANDTEALEAGEEMLKDTYLPESEGGENFFDWMTGEGRNEQGWAKINSQDSGQISDTSFGRLQTDDILGVMDDGKGMWQRWAQHPGEVRLFETALEGGNTSENTQRAKYAGELGMEGAQFAALALAGGGYALGPSMAGWSNKVKAVLLATKGGKIGQYGPQIGKTFRYARNASFIGSTGSYVASLYLGVGEGLAKEASLITEAVESGQMDADIAYTYLQAISGITNEEVPVSVTEADWYQDIQAAGPRTEDGAPTGVKAGGIPTAAENRQQYQDLADPTYEAPTAIEGATDGFNSPLDSQEQAVADNEEFIAANTPLAPFAERQEAYIASRGGVMGDMPHDLYVAPTVTTPRGESDEYTPYQKGVYMSDITREKYKPRYYMDDYNDIMAGWSGDKIEWFQQQAIEAGMLNPDEFSFRAGSRDANTRTAFSNLLVDSNANGNTWEDQLTDNIRSYQEWLVDNPEPEEPKYAAFVTPAYLAPDYATLAQQTKQTFDSKLRRKTTQAEMRIFTDYLGQEDRNQWAAQVQGDRQTHAARGREFETGDPQSGGTVQGVDAMARFDEFFEDKYAGELKHRDRTAQVERKQGGLFGSLNRIAGGI